jgi:hypothetical protein
MYDEPGFGRAEVPDDPALPLLYQVVYCSRAAEDVDEAAVAGIVASSRRHNPERAITGLLVYGSGVFFQWIEGPRAQIAQLMSILRDDPRHHDIVTLSETEELRERLFPAWDMEQVDAGDIRDVLEDALASASDPGNISALNRILDGLADGPLEAIGRT